MRLRNLFEDKGTAVVAFGRMNPPTIGHKKLADKVASLPGDPYIFVSQSQKPKTDPLPFPEKLKFAQASFPNVTVGSNDVKTIIQALQKVNAMGYTDLLYVAGSDRIADFTNLINKYNGKEYNFNNIEVVSAGERDPDAEGAEGMSASKMRAAAAAGDFESFQQGVANPKIAQQMYDAVRKGMGVVEGAMKRMAQSSSNKADRTASNNKLQPGLDTYKKKPESKKKVSEGFKLQLERGEDMDVLHIVNTDTGGRTEVRGKPGYERGNYDANDKLHQLLDRVGKSANISELINGEVVSINPKHPDGEKAKAATDVAYNENFADGKKKGKSRPGRVKRAGASCKGSVSSLRAKAKKYSGERGRMYHWCANMKGGKKK
jgi:nicotinic acid mononucleotide adenylyltransferase